MSKQSLSVTFNESCDVSALSCDVSLEHDDALNGGASAFEVGSQIFYRAYPADNYSCHVSNGGTIFVVCPEKVDTITEKITFNGSNKASLPHPVFGSFSYNWLGNAIKANTHEKVTPNISAQVGSDKITVDYPVYGSVSVVYDCSYASISFSPINSGEQTILACRICENIDEEACASLVEDIEDQYFDDVTLIIIDACNSSLKVAGAQATVDGELADSISDSNGQIHIGLLAKGTHSVKITAPAYISSDQDSLSNDEFIVE